uniref:Uncharacterized protein n=1 Tax=Strigamia maritima TaxID=126957 RepID=T1IIS4_STRMM
MHFKISIYRRSIVPVCSEENGRGDNGISNSIEEVCISGWDKPIRGKVYYHPIDDDPEFLGCTKLIIPIKRVQPIRPETNLTISNEPMEMTTTFQREFGTPTMNFQNVKRNIRKYEPPSEPISSETEYRNIFYAKPIAPAKPFNPKEQELLDGSMEKLSLYQRTFKGFDHCQMKNSKPMNYAPKRPKLERAKTPTRGISELQEVIRSSLYKVACLD